MNNLTILSLCALGGVLCSCGTTNNVPKYQLSDDTYEFRQPGKKYVKVYVDVDEDSVKVVPLDGTHPAEVQRGTDELFLKRSFDFDVLVVPFKYRPASVNVPRQLITDFNGGVFVGYRLDRFRIHFKKTPIGLKSQLGHRATSIGVFGGLGTTDINATTTNGGTSDEYKGLTLSRGIALMFGINNLTVGVGLGWDYLTDRDQDIWVFQNKPWLGLTLSLNLN